ncbi:MAG TPA: helix-turn-helix domain-containing protein [Anaerolineales bacterium]|nr:helix-turn-helix domain-containing protein [Anaerolineales bacterium]
MEPIQLSEEQKKALAWVERAGAVSPSQLAAQTKMLPQDTWDMLNKLAELGLIVMREDPDSVDGVLVFATMTTAQQVKKG